MAAFPVVRAKRNAAVQARLDLFPETPLSDVQRGVQAQVNVTLAQAGERVIELIESVDGYDVGQLITTLDRLHDAKAAASRALALAAPPRPAKQ